jgi:hypothetical protein
VFHRYFFPFFFLPQVSLLVRQAIGPIN